MDSCDRGLDTNGFKALTRRRLYKMIIAGGIREGTYILVKEFVLAQANRIDGEGEVLSGVFHLGYPTHVDTDLGILCSKTSMPLERITERGQTYQTT